MNKKAQKPREDELVLIETQQLYCVLLTNAWAAVMLSAGLREGAPGGAARCGSAKACSSLLVCWRLTLVLFLL